MIFFFFVKSFGNKAWISHLLMTTKGDCWVMIEVGALLSVILVVIVFIHETKTHFSPCQDNKDRPVCW